MKRLNWKEIPPLEKQVAEKEAKLESLTNQIATTKTKCNRKLTTMENEHNSIVDTLAVEIQILRNIINKYFENGHVNNEAYLAAVLPPSGLPASMSSLKDQWFHHRQDQNHYRLQKTATPTITIRRHNHHLTMTLNPSIQPFHNTLSLQSPKTSTTKTQLALPRFTCAIYTKTDTCTH